MLIKLGPKCKVSERRREEISGLVEMAAKGEVGERGREEEVDREVELVMEGELGDGGGDKFGLLVL